MKLEAPFIPLPLRFDVALLAQELALPPVKIHCSILAEDAIKAAVEDYKKKHVSIA
jgi:nitrogen fixation NifU-like protein